MKNILSIAFTLLLISSIVLSSSAQTGKKIQDAVITYDMKLDGENPMANMMGNITMKIGFSGMISIAQVNMMNGMITTDVYFDKTKKEGILLMNMMSKKIAIRMNEAEMQAYQQKQAINTAPPKIKYFKKTTKKIAGYKCYKVLATPSDGSEPIIMYVTDNIKPTATSQWEMQYPGMQGCPLSIEVTQQGMKVNIIATDVDAKASQNIEYLSEIPEGYEELSVEELQELSKGSGGIGL